MPPGRSDPEAVLFSELAGKNLVIEEKVDGAGVSIGFDDSLNLFVNHRGSPASGKEFVKLNQWAERHMDALYDVLATRFVMFGEWMYKKHTIYYDELPSFFLESDVYDREQDVWLSTGRRKTMFFGTRVQSVKVLQITTPTKLEDITGTVGISWYKLRWKKALQKHCEQNNFNFDKVMEETEDSDLMEGLYIKHESPGQVLGRYKYVRYEFLKKILDSQTHVLHRDIIPNQTAKP